MSCLSSQRTFVTALRLICNKRRTDSLPSTESLGSAQLELEEIDQSCSGEGRYFLEALQDARGESLDIRNGQ